MKQIMIVSTPTIEGRKKDVTHAMIHRKTCTY